MTKTKLELLDKELRAAKQGVRSIERAIIHTIRKMVLACPKCGTKNPLGKFTFIQVYVYERPHGCTEGDEHHPRESKHCSLSCPECESYFPIMDSDRALTIERAWTSRRIHPSNLFPSHTEADLRHGGIITMRTTVKRESVH